MANKIRMFRELKGITQEDLAEKVGTSQRTISAWENGQVPNGEMVIRLARALDTSTDYLLGLTDDPTPPSASKGTLSSSESEIIAALRRGEKYEAIRLIVMR